MNSTITNTHNTNFSGLINNNCIKQARQYALSTGQKEEFTNARKLVNSLAGDSLYITVRANIHPVECMHIKVLNKNSFDKNKFIG